MTQKQRATDIPKTQNFDYYLSVSQTKPHSKGKKEEKTKPHRKGKKEENKNINSHIMRKKKEKAGMPMKEIK